MPYELPQDPFERLEQVISTIFACRNIIKYNSSLNGEQKNELITDIDISLRSLRTDFVCHTATPTTLPRPQIHLAGKIMPVSTAHECDCNTSIALQELYRIYHSYIDTRQSNNIGTFVVRFDAVIAALNDVQHLLNECHDVYIRPTEDPLQHIRTFIADIYYMFMELVRTLSHVLEGSNVHSDTEKLSSMQQRQEISDPARYFASLSAAFLEHQRLNEMKGELSRRIGDARAFLIFMRESLEEDFYKRNELLVHFHSVALLLEDLSYVLAGYEEAVGLLLANDNDKDR